MRQCIFCSQNIKDLDYRDVATLKRFVSSQGKIIDPRHTGVCAKHQRKLARVVKQARTMGMLSAVRK